MKITHVNSDKLQKNPAFSHAVITEGGKTIYIGGQNGILLDGSLAGTDLATQSKQAYKNLLQLLDLAGATQQNVAKMNIHIVKGQDIKDGFGAAQEVWGNYPAAINVVIVDSLGLPGALVEIDAIAVLEA